MPGQCALVLAGATLLERRVQERGEADAGALSRNLQRLVRRRARPRRIGVERSGVEVWSDLGAVSALIRDAPHADTGVDPRGDLADAHSRHIEIGNISAHRRDLRWCIRADKIGEEPGERRTRRPDHRARGDRRAARVERAAVFRRSRASLHQRAARLHEGARSGAHAVRGAQEACGRFVEDRGECGWAHRRPALHGLVRADALMRHTRSAQPPL